MAFGQPLWLVRPTVSSDTAWTRAGQLLRVERGNWRESSSRSRGGVRTSEFNLSLNPPVKNVGQPLSFNLSRHRISFKGPAQVDLISHPNVLAEGLRQPTRDSNVLRLSIFPAVGFARRVSPPFLAALLLSPLLQPTLPPQLESTAEEAPDHHARSLRTGFTQAASHDSSAQGPARRLHGRPPRRAHRLLCPACLHLQGSSASSGRARTLADVYVLRRCWKASYLIWTRPRSD